MSLRALACAALALALPARAQAQCDVSHPSCPQAGASGVQPCFPELSGTIEQAARNELAANAPTYRQIHTGCNNPNPPTLVDATLPCTLLKAVAQTESTWSQFCSTCGGSGATLISFDCGYGIMQITSGMAGGAGFDPARVAAEPAYNVGTGAKILLDKWASTPCVGDNNPLVAEDWYMALWAYNGFGWVNNPNNPNFPASRQPYRSPGGLSRANYPYQEIVLGYASYPPIDNGQLRYPALPVSLPDRTQICNTSGCTVRNISDPATIHCDECQRGNAATLLSARPSGTLELAPGAKATVTFQLRNDGKTTWTSAAYHLAHVGGPSLGPEAIALPADVASGESVDVAVEITAPASGSATTQYGVFTAPCAFGPPLPIAVTVVGSTSGSSGSSGSTGGNDQDGDGHAAGPDDCNDADATIYRGAPELCDGKDNDCDGRVDNSPGLAVPVTRPCPDGGGVQTCGSGRWGACAALPGAPERCNGLDDDGNGLIDDGAPCPNGEVCTGGSCHPGPIKGSCGCASPGDAVSAGALLLAILAFRGRRATRA